MQMHQRSQIREAKHTGVEISSDTVEFLLFLLFAN